MSVAVLRRWAELGQRLCTPRTARRVSWEPAGRLVAASQRLFGAQVGQVAELLKRSEQRLHPLGEPLTTDFGAHRWLACDREEAYSDWLAWILQQLDTPHALCRLLKRELPPSLEHWQGTPSVRREHTVPHGHEGQRGRLDIVVRYAQLAIFVVEVKTTDADAADTAKQEGYKRWLDDQKVSHPFPILLATEGEEASDGGFKLLTWADLCVGLRWLARTLYAANRVTVAAMTLAFVGAVEQNLLGLSAPRPGWHSPTAVNPRLVPYLQRWLDEEAV